jgi:hypothetical protein
MSTPGTTGPLSPVSAASSPVDLRLNDSIDPSTAAAAAAAAGTGTDGLTSKEREQLNLQSSAFDALERDFREVLNELVGDKSLERFRLEYEKLHHTLKKSHENEKRLIKKVSYLDCSYHSQPFTYND